MHAVLMHVPQEEVASPSDYRLPGGAGPADWWLAVLLDDGASTERKDAAAKELRRLGPVAVRKAQARREAMVEDEWFASLPAEQQRNLLRG